MTVPRPAGTSAVQDRGESSYAGPDSDFAIIVVESIEGRAAESVLAAASITIGRKLRKADVIFRYARSSSWFYFLKRHWQQPWPSPS